MRSQLRTLRASFLFVYAPVSIILMATAAIALSTSVSVSYLIRDPTAVIGVPFYAGAISSIGVLLWWSAATVCLVGAVVLHREGRSLEERRFLLCAGALTVLLALDDLFLLHEEVAPLYLGLDDSVVYASYAVLAAAMFVGFQRVVRASDFLLLLLALACFSGSILVDVVHDSLGIRIYGSMFVEDGFKLLGIAGWLSYFGNLSISQMTASRAGASSEYERAQSAPRAAAGI